jgi:hypothetical protein
MDVKKTAKTKLRNLIQPILVRKSYRYLGIPPRIKTNSAIRIMNFKDILKAANGTYFNRMLGIKELINSSKYSFNLCIRSKKPYW